MTFVCPINGCVAIVDDPRTPCLGCRRVFGSTLRPTGRRAPDLHEFIKTTAAADARVRDLLAERREIEKERSA